MVRNEYGTNHDQGMSLFSRSTMYSTGPLRAENMKVLASPNAQVIPLFVLAAKQSEWLPSARIEIARASQPEDSTSVLAGMKTEQVQYGIFNVLEGARAHEQGAENLHLAASFLWGSPLILAKDDVQAGHWTALGGSIGVTTAPVHMPLYALGKRTLRKGGLADADIDLRSMSHSECVNMMKDGAVRPAFAILAEPEVTQVLSQQQREDWPLRYRRFADVTTLLNPDGLPLGGLWVIGHPAHAANFLNGFKRAVSYVNDPQNIPSVSGMVVQGFQTYFNAFPDLGSAEVSDMLKRGNLILKYKEAKAISGDLMSLWHDFGLSPNPDIIYVGQD